MFCKEYLVDLNATQAYIRAGYSKKTANQCGYLLLVNPCIQEYIQKNMDKRAEKIELTSEYVLNNIIEIGERCMQKEQVKDKDGFPTGEWEFKEGGALKAQELLGRNLQMFTDKVLHTGDKDNPVVIQDYDNLSTKEKLRILNERISRGKTK